MSISSNQAEAELESNIDHSLTANDNGSSSSPSAAPAESKEDGPALKRPSIASLLSASNQVAANEERFARGLDQFSVARNGMPSYGLPYGMSPGYGPGQHHGQSNNPQQVYGAYVSSLVGKQKSSKNGEMGPDEEDQNGTHGQIYGAQSQQPQQVPQQQQVGYQGYPYAYSNNYYYQNGAYAQQPGSTASFGRPGPGYYYGNQQFNGNNVSDAYQAIDQNPGVSSRSGAISQQNQPQQVVPGDQSVMSDKALGGEPKTKKRKKMSSVVTPATTIERPYHCTYEGCEWSFARLSDQRRHIRSHEKPTFHCPYWRSDPTCHRNGGAFNRLDVLKRHLRLVHFVQFKQSESGWCRVCQKMFTSPKHFVEHCEACASAVRPAEWKVDDESQLFAPVENSRSTMTIQSKQPIGDESTTLMMLASVDPNVDSQLTAADKNRTRTRAGPGRKKTLSHAVNAGHHVTEPGV